METKGQNLGGDMGRDSGFDFRGLTRLGERDPLLEVLC